QHPVGVKFAEGSTISEMIRADNDVPAQLWEEEPDRAQVFFQGHDGIFRLRPDNPQLARIRAQLGAAIRQQARDWFIVQKPDLTLLDVLPGGWAAEVSETRQGVSVEIDVSFVVAPDHLLRIADEILRSRIRCTKALRHVIRAVAKAYIDEADELNRAAREVQ